MKPMHAKVFAMPSFEAEDTLTNAWSRGPTRMRPYATRLTLNIGLE